MTQENRTTASSLLQLIGMLLLAIMALLPLLDINHEWMRWVYALGALLTLVAQLIYRYTGTSLRIKRLYRILTVSALLYCASALLVFIYRGSTDWIAFLLAGAILQIYATWMIELTSKKEDNQQKK